MAKGKGISFAGALASIWMLAGQPAEAQFYKDRTLTLLINYGVGGNADTEARVYQRFLPKYIPGNPSVIIQNAPGAGGINGINMLGMSIGAKADGYTMGYFTVSATDSLVENPALKVKLEDFAYVAGARGWNVAYARKDTPPGLNKPTDFVKATKLFIGGYSRASSHDTRLRLSAEIMGLPYQLVTGFPATAAINKAMLQGEVNYTGSSLPGYQTQVIPQIITPGVGVALFQFPLIGNDGKPLGNPNLTSAGLPTFDDFYQSAFNKPPTGPKYDAMALMNDIGGKLQRAMVFHHDTPVEAVKTMREAIAKVAADPEFQAEFQRVTSERADIVPAEELSPLFDRIRNVDPAVRKVLKDAVGE